MALPLASWLVRFQRGALMFIATALLYPCALAALCLGTGLLVDRCSRPGLAAPLLLPVGAAGLIAVSQLSTYVYPLAPATPYLVLAVALAGFWLGRARAARLLASMRRRAWLPAASLLAYLIALAPVLAAGRTTFSSFMVLSDSAVHLIGADFLIRHGQHYAHLDLRNSYGQFINAYYNTSYPSGADTLFGASALLLGLPLIWAFQPFNAFMLATAVGPAWAIARRLGLAGAWGIVAALTAVLGALVYAYELFGSVKEITALPFILALGALVCRNRSWLDRGATGAIPFALLLAAGVSALGAAFGAWVLVSVAVPAFVLLRRLIGRGGYRPRSALGLLAGGGAVLLVAAWPTWVDLPGSLKVAQNIATTTNSGNLHSPLRAVQVFGVWLGGSYKLAPGGGALVATHLLIALSAAAALLGVVQLLRRRAFALAGWLALMLLAWLLVSLTATTWASAKTEMLTSPAVILLAWGGVAALRALPLRRVAAAAAALTALGIAGGALASDALQYHVANLAPTARYRELASLDARFAGQGPALFTDFDEYSMYELRDLDPGGPDFVYPPPALASAAGGYGDPVQLDRISPSALASYPLIVTRRDPAQSRPPAAYGLVWQGSYYEAWRRLPRAVPAIEHLALSGGPAQQCRQIGRLAAASARHFEHGVGGAPTGLVAASAPMIVPIDLHRAFHPRGWGHERSGLVMSRPGRLSAGFRVPAGGPWDLWVQGQIMPTVHLSLDGRPLASIGGQLSGNSLVPDTIPPIPVRLAAGAHRLWVTRGSTTLAPGDGGAAVLDAVLLTPAATPAAAPLRHSTVSRWQALCGTAYQWVELSP